MINHRSTAFAHLLDRCRRRLQASFGTTNDVLLFGGSGTTGLEASAANTIVPGNKVLVCVNGWFGRMWADICSLYGAHVTVVDAPWGSPIDPDAVERALASDGQVAAVFVTHNETSTGVTNDLPAIAAVVKRHDVLFVVDSIGGVGCLPLAVDDLGIDVVVTASQKGWLAPPGLAMVAVSARALHRSASTTSPKYAYDFAVQKRCHDRGETLTTPPLSVLYALDEGLAMREEEGVDHVLGRHQLVAGIMRSGLTAMGLELFADRRARSDSVTAVRNPFGDPASLEAFLEELRVTYRLTLASGHGPLRGEIFRIGHMGDIRVSDAYDVLQRLHAALPESVTATDIDGVLSAAGIAEHDQEAVGS
jgi:aspartate aminotransferase-like enzyme